MSRENTGRWYKRRGVCKQPRALRDGHQLHREGGFTEEVIWSQAKKKKKSAHQDRAAKMEDLKTTGERGKQRWRSPALSTGLAQG